MFQSSGYLCSIPLGPKESMSFFCKCPQSPDFLHHHGLFVAFCCIAPTLDLKTRHSSYVSQRARPTYVLRICKHIYFPCKTWTFYPYFRKEKKVNLSHYSLVITSLIPEMGELDFVAVAVWRISSLEQFLSACFTLSCKGTFPHFVFDWSN